MCFCTKHLFKISVINCINFTQHTVADFIRILIIIFFAFFYLLYFRFVKLCASFLRFIDIAKNK